MTPGATATHPRRRRKPGRPPGDTLERGTRERIVSAAVTAFAEAGFHGASLRNVAESVAISSPTLLHHVGSKEALYSEVLERIRESLEHSSMLTDATVHRTEGDPADGLVHLARGYLAWTRGNDAYARIILRELMDNTARARAARKWHLAPVVQRVATVVRTAQKHGFLAGASPELLVLQIVGSIAYVSVGLPTVMHVIEPVPSERALSDAFAHQMTVSVRALVHGWPAPRTRARTLRKRGSA